jgi:hypothetical protein
MAALIYNEGADQANRQPHVRDIKSGGWVVLVTVERHMTSGTVRREEECSWRCLTEVMLSRFIRARRRIPADNW